MYVNVGKKIVIVSKRLGLDAKSEPEIRGRYMINDLISPWPGYAVSKPQDYEMCNKLIVV